MLVECPAGHLHARDTPERGVVSRYPDQRFDNQPFPDEVGRRIAPPWVILKPLGHERTDGHGGQEPDPLHPLAHRWHQLHREPVGNLVEAEGVESPFARARRIVAGEEWEHHVGTQPLVAAHVDASLLRPWA